MSGTLFICATPIGNLGDVSTRLIETFGRADVVFAEDTRRTGRLLASLGISVPIRSYFLGNERQRATELGDRLSAGEIVVLVSDAGTPVVSDPGLSAVRVAGQVGANVSVIPGPSAVTALLAVSGFNGDRFVFEGFLPRKGAERAQRLESIGTEPRTVVFFTTGKRLHSDLKDLQEYGRDDRAVVIGRELTKLHEQIWRGTLRDAIREWEAETRGEITVALDGAAAEVGSLDTAVSEVIGMIAAGSPMSEATKAAAKRHRLKRSDVYDAVLAERQRS